MKAELTLSALAITAILGAVTIFSSTYTVDQGERGVLLRNGALVSVEEPGLGFKFPFIDKVRKVSIQDQAAIYEGVAAYSADQQPAYLVVSVNYAVPADRVAEVYSEYGNAEVLKSRLIERKLFSAVKNVFGRYNAIRAVQERANLTADVQAAVQDAVDGPVLITGIQIENIDFSDAYENKIEERMSAEIEVEKLKQNLEREKVSADITVTKAKADAAAAVASAEARATAVKMQGEAEAAAISAKGKALRDNPALVELTAAERWDGVLPSTMVPGSAVPFVSMK